LEIFQILDHPPQVVRVDQASKLLTDDFQLYRPRSRKQMNQMCHCGGDTAYFIRCLLKLCDASVWQRPEISNQIPNDRGGRSNGGEQVAVRSL